MAHGVHRAMDPQEAAALDLASYPATRIPEVIQLAAGHDAMLTLGQPRQTCVTWCTVSGLILHSGDRGPGRCDETRRVWNLSATFAQQQRCNQSQRRGGQNGSALPRGRLAPGQLV